MFKSDTTKDRVEVVLDGRTVSLLSGISVAAALLEIGKIISRKSPTSGSPCSPHCLMGICFECMMEIDGVQRQACMTPVRPGMSIKRHLEKEEVHEPS